MLNPEAAGFVTTSHSHVAIKVGQTGTSTWLSNGKRRFVGGLPQTPSTSVRFQRSQMVRFAERGCILSTSSWRLRTICNVAVIKSVVASIWS